MEGSREVCRSRGRLAGFMQRHKQEPTLFRERVAL